MDALESQVIGDVINRLDEICLLLESTELWGEAAQLAKAQKLLENLSAPASPKKVLKSRIK